MSGGGPLKIKVSKPSDNFAAYPFAFMPLPNTDGDEIFLKSIPELSPKHQIAFLLCPFANKQTKEKNHIKIHFFIFELQA